MTILIDIGNTAIKWQLREPEQTILTGRGDVSQLMVWLESLGNLPSQRVAASCVRDDEFAGELHDALLQLGCSSVVFAESSATHGGITNAYANPSSLGVDRWVAILALKSRGHESGIVVDIGTACTIDILEKDRHVGGFILPGPKLACDALVANTDKIRYSTEPPAALEPGSDTGACVVSGAWLTIVGAVKEITLRYPQCPLFLAGGAAATLIDLGVEGELVTDLVFDGLHFWLNGA